MPGSHRATAVQWRFPPTRDTATERRDGCQEHEPGRGFGGRLETGMSQASLQGDTCGAPTKPVPVHATAHPPVVCLRCRTVPFPENKTGLDPACRAEARPTGNRRAPGRITRDCQQLLPAVCCTSSIREGRSRSHGSGGERRARRLGSRERLQPWGSGVYATWAAGRSDLVNTSSSFLTSTRITSPDMNLPLRISWASGFSIRVWMARLSGLAP